MQIHEITKENRTQFENFIISKPIILFFFNHHYHSNFSNTKFWITEEGNEISGVMFFDGNQNKIYGTSASVEFFLDSLEDFPSYISIPHSSSHLLEKYISTKKKKLFMHRLYMKKQEISLPTNEKFKQLAKEDMNAALHVFQAAEPDDWNNSKVEDLPFDENNLWYAIEYNGELTSVCWNQCHSYGGHIAFIGTHPNHQNKGFATKLLKYAISENFKYNSLSIIHVRDENKPALHVYQKIGYIDKLKSITLVEPEKKTKNN